MVFKGFMPLGDGCILLIGESFKFGFIQNEVLTGWDVVGDKFGILLTEVEDENRGVFKSCDSDIAFFFVPLFVQSPPDSPTVLITS